MATVGSTSCLSCWKLSSRALQRKVFLRGLCRTAQRCTAHNLVMPAMSPTMTEGNITIWKVTEGDSFSAGDVLLEIETDKAQMDVEAQDNGVLAKIMEQDGAKSVKVGSRIAVLAEEGDDLSSLEISPEEHSLEPSASESKRQKKEVNSSKSTVSGTISDSYLRSEKSDSRTSSTSHPQSNDSTAGHSYKYPLYPSVMHLLHTNSISEPQLAEISHTGPGGRLLKGDVLSYLNRVPKSYPLEQSERISKLEHLDLSNIKVASKKAEAQTRSKGDSRSVEKEEPVVQVSVPISLHTVYTTQGKIKKSLGLIFPTSVFIARASEIANDDLPPAKRVAPTADELFDTLLGMNSTPRITRGHYLPIVTPLPSQSIYTRAVSRPLELDIVDILTGTARKLVGREPSSTARNLPMEASPAGKLFSLEVSKHEEGRAKVYLERVKTVLEIEPGRCVL